jgi:hypothetical protein
MPPCYQLLNDNSVVLKCLCHHQCVMALCYSHTLNGNGERGVATEQQTRKRRELVERVVASLALELVGVCGNTTMVSGNLGEF